MDKGVIYTAIGEKFIGEAVNAASSLKKLHPYLSTTLYTDRNTSSKYFDKVFIIDNPKRNYRDRIVSMIKSPYQYTLALDTDTYICQDILSLFELLNNYDFAAAHAPIRKAPEREGPHGGYAIEGVPDSFPEVNGGVLLFRKNERTLKFLRYWLKLYNDIIEKFGNTKSDQPVLRKALYECNIKHSILTSEYNCRYSMPTYVHGDVKILHGRSPDPMHMAKKLNKTHSQRVVIPGIGIVSKKNFFVRFLNKIKSLRSH